MVLETHRRKDFFKKSFNFFFFKKGCPGIITVMMWSLMKMTLSLSKARFQRPVLKNLS
jgi:hypothetical protein